MRIRIMVKHKDYFGAIFMGTIWSIFCSVLSLGIWWFVKTATDGNIDLALIAGLLCFGIVVYKGKDFYKVEMRTVRADDPKTDWRGYLNDLQIICIAIIAVNAANSFSDGFSWMGLGAFIFGWLFILIILHLKNTRFSK